VTRSAHRKLAAYPPERLATLDPSLFRFAFQHDLRVAIDTSATSILFEAGFVQRLRELHRFEPRVLVARGTRLPGLPKAPSGFGWTIVAFRLEDLELALAFEKLLFRYLNLPQGSSPEDEAERLAVQREFLRLFPRIDLKPGEKGAFRLKWSAQYEFASANGVDFRTSPMRLWLLLDPKDGYFEVLKGPIRARR
jgi:hypothetical protein